MTLAADVSQSVARLVHGTPISVPLVAVAPNSLVAFFCLADADNGNATESLSIGTTGGLTWTKRVERNGSPGAVSTIFTAPFPAGGSITPTVIDSDGMVDVSAEIAVIPVIFTDTNGSIPGTGATGTGTGSTNTTTTIANSWVWGCGLGTGVDNGTQTRIFFTSGGTFDGGDDINAAKSNATTPTPGTVVNLALGSIFTTAIEITPGPGSSTPVFDSSGSTPILVGATTASPDITAAAVGAWVYLWVALGNSLGGAVTGTGWTTVVEGDEGAACHYAVLKHQKAVGETTMPVAFNGVSSKGTLQWVSYINVDPRIQDECATLAVNGATSRTAVPTPTAVALGPNRIALTFYANRTTTVGNKPITWTPDAALTELVDVDNNAAGSSPWVGTESAASAAAVTQGSHSYTATHAPAAESHDGSVILFLVPPGEAFVGYPDAPQIGLDLFTALLLAQDNLWADPTQINVGVTVDDTAGVSAALAASVTETVAIDVIITDVASAALAAGLTTETADVVTIAAVDVPSAALAAGLTSETVVFDTVVVDSASAALAASVTELIVSDTILTDTPSGALGASVTESVSIGVTVADIPAAALAGSVTESVVNDILVSDAPSGALAAGLLTEATVTDVTVTDTPSAGLAALITGESVGSVTLVDDTPNVFGALAASLTETVVIGVTITDAPSGSVAASLVETVSSDTIVADNAPTAALAGTLADSVAIGVTINDAPAGSVAGAVSETANVGVTVIDAISAALAGISSETTIYGVVILDTPAAGLAAGPLQFEGIGQGTFVDGSAVFGALAGAWQETVSIGAPPGDIHVFIREGHVSAAIVQGPIAAHIRLAVVSSDLAEASASVEIREADVTAHREG